MSERTIQCRLCGGNGCEEGCGYCDHWNEGPDSHKVCVRCGGKGVETIEMQEQR